MSRSDGNAPEFPEVNRRLAEHYTSLHTQYGDDYRTAQYSDRPSQEARFAVLADIGVAPDSSVLDFGCGMGDLLGFLRQTRGFAGEYTGYDLSEDVVAAARKKHEGANACFEVRDIFQDAPSKQVDFVLICGTFNINFGANRAYVRRALEILFPLCRRGLAFNLMSTYVDFKQPDLYYADPEETFEYCKTKLSAAVALRHDYIVRSGGMPFEFTIYVRRMDVGLRTKLEPSA